jgi:hypothetical protein
MIVEYLSNRMIGAYIVLNEFELSEEFSLPIVIVNRNQSVIIFNVWLSKTALECKKNSDRITIYTAYELLRTEERNIDSHTHPDVIRLAKTRRLTAVCRIKLCSIYQDNNAHSRNFTL